MTSAGADSRRTTDPGPSNNNQANNGSSSFAAATSGIILYTPRNPLERKNLAAPPSFPTPLIQARQRRPHSIHIISYPPGYIPPDLRPKPAPRAKKSKGQKEKGKEAERKESTASPPGGSLACDPRTRRLFGSFSLGTSTSTVALGLAAQEDGSALPAAALALAAGATPSPSAAGATSDESYQSGSSDISPISPTTDPRATTNSFLAPTFQDPASRPPASPELPEVLPFSIRGPSGPLDLATPSTSTTRSSTPIPTPTASLPALPRLAHEELHHNTMSRHSATMDPALRPSLLNTHLNNSHRNSILSSRSAGKSAISAHVVEVPKPVASGSGVSCSILLAEPNVFLSGFDHDGHRRQGSANATSLLRGKLQLNVSKNVKIKSVTLKLVGRARTEWPEGIPPLKVDLYEEESLRNMALTFFNAMTPISWETEYGNQCQYSIRNSSNNSSTTNLASPVSSPLSTQTTASATTPTSLAHHRLSNSLAPGQSVSGRPRHNTVLTAKELKKLSLQSAQSRSFGKGESPAAAQLNTKGYKVFYPGTYEYSFELPIDHHQLETTKLQYGSVKWELEAIVERAGAFKPTLHGSKEVSIVRVPDQLSLEMSEPISISRQWEDQLHYDIIISGKSFPIGSKIPIAFKLTPLAKVQVHKLKVFVTESIEYWTSDHRVTRKDPGRKILLFEKAAGKELEPKYESSEVRTLSGGELTSEERYMARQNAVRRRADAARRSGMVAQPLSEPTDNLLGDLDLGLEALWGSTELEMNVQVPTCETMAKDKSLRLHPDCSWKNVNVYHWIKIVMRISRLDPDDPSGTRRRHFEISIDSPFTVLDCRATQANTSLPRYPAGGMDGTGVNSYRHTTACGCPDAAVLSSSAPSPASSTGTLMTDSVLGNGQGQAVDAGNASQSNAFPTLPQAAHFVSGPQPRPSATAHRDNSAGEGSGSGASAAPPSWTTNVASANSTPSGSAANSPIIRPSGGAFGVPPSAPMPFRPIHLLRYPSFNPPAFDADVAPPTAGDDDGQTPGRGLVMTPPPCYDAIVGTPSVDGLADYFARLASYDNEQNEADGDGVAMSATTINGVVAVPVAGTETLEAELAATGLRVDQPPAPNDGAAREDDADSSSASSDDEGELSMRRPARLTERTGRVNVANPRTPGPSGMPALSIVPSRSFEIERPVVQLNLDAVRAATRRNVAGVALPAPVGA